MNNIQAEANNRTNASEILSDLKTIIGDFYVAELDLNGQSLFLKLVNGQKFEISVSEAI